MDERTWPSKLLDALATLLAVWLCLIIAGLTGARLQPGMLGAALSLAVCIGLLSAWGCWTGPGRRTPLFVYLIAGLFYPVLTTALILIVPTELALGPLSWIVAGMAVGFQSGGGPDAPAQIYIVPMVMNLFGPILAMGLLRHWVRADETG